MKLLVKIQQPRVTKHLLATACAAAASRKALALATGEPTTHRPNSEEDGASDSEPELELDREEQGPQSYPQRTPTDAALQAYLSLEGMSLATAIEVFSDADDDDGDDEQADAVHLQDERVDEDGIGFQLSPSPSHHPLLIPSSDPLCECPLTTNVDGSHKESDAVPNEGDRVEGMNEGGSGTSCSNDDETPAGNPNANSGSLR